MLKNLYIFGVKQTAIANGDWILTESVTSFSIADELCVIIYSLFSTSTSMYVLIDKSLLKHNDLKCKAKLLIQHLYKVHFLEMYLSVLRNIGMKAYAL